MEESNKCVEYDERDKVSHTGKVSEGFESSLSHWCSCSPGDLGVQQLPEAAGDPDQAGRLVQQSGRERRQRSARRQEAALSLPSTTRHRPPPGPRATRRTRDRARNRRKITERAASRHVSIYHILYIYIYI